eukprot:COSAG01_NODE_16978_length_1189_cov_4.379247_1_plen_44_part_10
MAQGPPNDTPTKGVKKIPWSREEDEKLTAAVMAFKERPVAGGGA